MRRLAIILALAMASTAYGAAPFQMSLDAAKTGELPQGWIAAKTGSGPGSVWKVVADLDGKKVLAQTSDKGRDGLFNLCVAEKTNFTDIDLSVRFKAVAGKQDRGGGPVWRYKDSSNYYIARMNPLEDNFRVYKVVGGKRTQLASADVKAAAGQWHTLRVVHKGDHIECYLNGKSYLDVKDDTFKDAGKIGLWTKADAQTYFADLRVPFTAADAPTTQEIARLVREYAFSDKPKLNPKTDFRIRRLEVKGLWDQTHLQVFDVQYYVDGQHFNGFNGLYHRGKVSPLGSSFGGFGLMSGVVCNGAFYYSFSFGSGIHRSHIGKIQVVDGQIKCWDSGGFEETNDLADLFVDKVGENSIRVFSGEFKDFNRWEAGKEFGKIEEASASHLKVIGRDGKAIPPTFPDLLYRPESERKE